MSKDKDTVRTRGTLFPVAIQAAIFFPGAKKTNRKVV